MTYHRAKEKWIGAETIAQRRQEVGQKPRKGVGMTRREGRGRVLLMEARSQFEAQAEGGSIPGFLKELWSLGWVQVPALQVLSLNINHFTPVNLGFFSEMEVMMSTLCGYKDEVKGNEDYHKCWGALHLLPDLFSKHLVVVVVWLHQAPCWILIP